MGLQSESQLLRFGYKDPSQRITGHSDAFQKDFQLFSHHLHSPQLKRPSFGRSSTPRPTRNNLLGPTDMNTVISPRTSVMAELNAPHPCTISSKETDRQSDNARDEPMTRRGTAWALYLFWSVFGNVTSLLRRARISPGHVYDVLPQRPVDVRTELMSCRWWKMKVILRGGGV